MYSTLEDLGRAAKPFATDSLLSPSSRAELHRWRQAGGGECGFLISRNRVGVGHDGDVTGFNAVVRYQPARRRAVVVLTNLSNRADGKMPAVELAKLMTGASQPSEQGPPPARDPVSGDRGQRWRGDHQEPSPNASASARVD